ncbi:MAG: hypothetical protein IPH80_34635 [Myxococcales bacterium]|nr:hypothetical protein [Myxococcales bacterium]
MSEIKPPTPNDTTRQASPTSQPPKPTRPSKRKRKAARPAPPLTPPWIESGIDYDPALVAIEELIDWAFGVAAASVADAPADVRRVRNARRYALAAIHGKADPRSVDDVVFAAGLLARVLDADLGLGLGDIVTVLEQMGLPADDVPSPPRRPPGRRQARAASAPIDLTAVLDAVAAIQSLTPIVPLRPRGARVPAALAATCAACPARGFRVAA